MACGVCAGVVFLLLAVLAACGAAARGEAAPDIFRPPFTPAVPKPVKVAAPVAPDT